MTEKKKKPRLPRTSRKPQILLIIIALLFPLWIGSYGFLYRELEPEVFEWALDPSEAMIAERAQELAQRAIREAGIPEERAQRVSTEQAEGDHWIVRFDDRHSPEGWWVRIDPRGETVRVEVGRVM